MPSTPEPELQDDCPDETPWKSLFTFTCRKHLAVVIIGAFFAICAGFITPIFAIFLGRVFEEFTSYGAGQITASTLRSKITANCIKIVILGVADWGLNTAYFGIFVGAGEFYAERIREKVFRELLKRDIEWFEAQKEGSGALLSGIQAHINDLQTATSQPLGLIIQYASRSFVSFVLALVFSWKLSLVTLAGIPLFSFAIGYLSMLMESSVKAQEVELTHVSKIANNAFASIDTVKCLNGQAFELRKFANRIERSAIHYLRQARLNSLQIAVIRWMMFGMFVQGFWYGSHLARLGTLSSGDVITTFWLCTTAAQSIEQVLPQSIFMEKGKAASGILKRMMGERTANVTGSEVNGNVTPGICFGNIQVNNVSFSYPSQLETSVLKNASFQFPAGETVFVIGKSGSGKSTLGQLLMRFYLPTTGEILIDGHPIESLDITWIRQNITLLEQRSVLFNDSLGRNISLGRLDSRDALDYSPYGVLESIKFAMLHNTIEGLPRGINTSVGPRGSFLSGGQRQRVAIARAHLRDTPILILDEPTSALDHANRVSIMKSIREWRKGKTTIIITHDMSQIQQNDFAYVLENGVITHSGTRYDLENRSGCAKYFPMEARSDSDSEKNIQNAKISSSRTSTLGSLRIPKRLRHTRRISFAQHHLPPGFRSTTFEMQTRRHSVDVGRMSEQSDPMTQERRFIHLYPNGSSPDLSLQLSDEEEEPGQNIEMVEIETPVTEPQNRMHYISPERLPSIKRKKEKRFRGFNNSQKNKPSLKQIMGTIVPSLTLKQRLILFLGVASALAHAAATPVFSYCLSQLLASFYVTEDSAKIAMKWSLAVLGVSCADGLSSFFMHYFLEFSAEAWMDMLRINAFEKVLGQPKSWFEQEGHEAFRLASYLDQNGEDMRNLLGRFAGFVIVAVGIMVIAVIWSLIVCWKLTLVTLACGPFIYLITRGFEATNGLWERKCTEANSAMFDIFTETFMEIRTVRSLTLEKYFLTKKQWAQLECTRVGTARARYTGLMFGLVEPTVMCSTALIFYYGAILAASEFTVDDVVKVFSLLLFSIGYAAQILSWIPQINTSREIATRLLHLSHLPKFGSHEDRGSLTLSTLTPIELKNVYFRYPSRPDTRVLRNVSIKIEHNSCTAIVGRSGSGKSTIASLLLALYKAPESRSNEPTILMGGEDIEHLHVPTLRSQIAIVSQQPTIFPGSIHANISYGIEPQAPMASIDSVRNAAKAAGIDEFIMSLPKGYWTEIGDGGIGLSGGQNQRLVIARALLRHPQILILDEATSSLDPEGAELVRQSIQRLVASRNDLTVIIITHAREMIEIADHVIVLNDGLVVEDGRYDVLSQNIGGKLYELMNYSEGGG